MNILIIELAKEIKANQIISSFIVREISIIFLINSFYLPKEE